MPRPTPAATIKREALTAIREKDGQSKTTLARAARISIGYLADLESGRRQGNPDVIARLAAALNVPKSAIETERPSA